LLSRSLIPTAILALLASSCTVTVSRDDLDSLLRAYEVRTAVMESRFTVMSNFTAARTADLVEAFREELPHVEQLYGLELEDRLQIYLLPMMEAEITEDDGGYLLSFADKPGYQAYTDHKTKIVVLLYPDLELPDGQIVFAVQDRRDYRDSLRHELSHICSHKVVDELPTWLDEGIAHYVGRTRWIDDRPVVPRELPLLPGDRDISLLELVSWKEDGSLVVAGEAHSRGDMRRMALALVTFLIQQQPEGQPMAETLEHLAALTTDELAALEPDFLHWLDRQ